MTVTLIRLVATTVVLAGCYDPIESDDRATALQVRVTSDTAPADGASLVEVDLAGPEHSSGASVTLSVSSGRLTGASQNTLTLHLSQQGTAAAQWQAPLSTGPATVSARVSDVPLRVDTVQFIRATPDTVEVEPQSPSVSATPASALTITVHLRRSIGIVTPGARASFGAVDTAGAAIGRFLSSTPSDSSGTITARYAPGSTLYRGLVSITATVLTVTPPRLGRTLVEVTN